MVDVRLLFYSFIINIIFVAGGIEDPSLEVTLKA
jgi:hypothetical protein